MYSELWNNFGVRVTLTEIWTFIDLILSEHFLKGILALCSLIHLTSLKDITSLKTVSHLIFSGSGSTIIINMSIDKSI